MSKKTLSTRPYKGTRDFYPEDYRVHQYMFDVIRTVLYRFGYEEYMAPLLEETDLYRAKSGEEIVNEQTYSFEDRGGRDLTIRPEMTPSLARMVARRSGDYTYPLRWFSIPNLYRYERPQRGRLREHYQVNVDIFGTESKYADIEALDVARSLLTEFGATSEDFEIHINDRRLIHAVYSEVLGLSEEQSYALSKLVDRKDKISTEEFQSQVREIVAQDTAKHLETLLEKDSFEAFVAYLREISSDNQIVEDAIQSFETFLNGVRQVGMSNVIFDFELMRGFDYYTGFVFEVFDTHPDNNRAMFGGGRYDNLLEIFDQPPMGAIGFGMGDVPLWVFLETHGLLPQVEDRIDAYVCVLDTQYLAAAYEYTQMLRSHDFSVVMDYSGRKLSAQLKTADRKNARFALCLGEQEVRNETVTVRTLATGEQETVSFEKAVALLKQV